MIPHSHLCRQPNVHVNLEAGIEKAASLTYKM